MRRFCAEALAVLAILAATMCAGAAFSSTEGSLTTTSGGSLNFTVTKPARVDINNLSDMVLPAWIIGDGDVTMLNDVCVYSTRPSGGYTIQPSGSGAGGAFLLANGSNTLSYSVSWNAGGVGNLSNTGTPLSANTVSGPLSHAATDSATCSGTSAGPTARLIVFISNAEMSSVPSGPYTGTLTLLVMPN